MGPELLALLITKQPLRVAEVKPLVCLWPKPPLRSFDGAAAESALCPNLGVHLTCNYKILRRCSEGKVGTNLELPESAVDAMERPVGGGYGSPNPNYRTRFTWISQLSK